MQSQISAGDIRLMALKRILLNASLELQRASISTAVLDLETVEPFVLTARESLKEAISKLAEVGLNTQVKSEGIFNIIFAMQ